MKKLLFGLIATVFFGLGANAQKGLIGKLNFENISYDVYNEYSSKFIDGKFSYNVKIDKNFEITEKNYENSAVLTDSKGETIKIDNISIRENIIKFDLIGSNGKIIKGATYSGNNVNQKFCWKCVATIVAAAADALSDAFSTSDCSVAINACVAAGGIPSTTITSGFFGQDCSVSCAPKP